MVKGIKEIKNIIVVYSIILIIWGFYRLLFKLPDQIEEVFVKPIVWLVPTVWAVKQEDRTRNFVEILESLFWTFKNLFKSLYISIGLGIVFAVLGFWANTLKYGRINFSNLTEVSLIGGLLLSLATAISEETVFRGYIFARLLKFFRNEWVANCLSTLGWAIIHIPVAIFVFKLQAGNLFITILLSSLFGFGSAFVFARTENIVSSVLLHVFWEWPIILFR